jgi:hypothetical protein
MKQNHIHIKIKILIFFMFLNALINAQINIQGTLVDSTNAPVEFATLAVKEGNTVVGSSLSDLDGNYKISIPNKGSFLFQIFCVGFIAKEIKVDVTRDTIISFVLSKKESNLKEVVVTGKASVIERKVDRLVFNVENSVAATGGDALDALKITPGVLFNNEVLSMVGKSGLKLMINDKLVQLSGDELANFLRSISASNVSKIEVITNPSSKYDAEGNSGLINIRLKTARANTWNSTINGSFIKNTYSTGRGGASFNYQKKKVSIYSTLSVSQGARQITDQAKQYYTSQLLSTRAPRKVEIASLTGACGVDYSITNNWSVGAQYIGSGSKLNIDNKSVTTLFNQNNSIDSTLRTNSQSTENSGNHSININSSVNLDTTGKRILFNVDYFTYQSNTDGKLRNNNFLPDETATLNSFYSNNNISQLKTSNYSGKIDVENPLKVVNLSYGGKFSRTKTDNNLIFYNTTSGESIIDSNVTNKFGYDEQNVALYFSGNKKINKWDIQVGLRAENTQTKGTSYTLKQVSKYSYLKIFPTAYILYTANPSSSFLMNYGRRINRPNYEQLNPFRIYINPYSYVEGNPFLRPSFSDNIDLIYRYKNLENKLFYSNTKNGFQQLAIVDPNSIKQRMIVENFFNTDLYGISESFQFNKIDWWNSNNSFFMYYSISKSSSPITTNKLESFNSFASTSNDFTISESKKLYLNLSYFYSFPGTSDLSKKSASSQFDASVKILFFKKALSFAFAVQDIFSSNRPTYTQYSNGVKVEYKNYYDNRFLRVSLSYKFGNNKINVQKKEFGNADEKDRTLNK